MKNRGGYSAASGEPKIFLADGLDEEFKKKLEFIYCRLLVIGLMQECEEREKNEDKK